MEEDNNTPMSPVGEEEDNGPMSPQSPPGSPPSPDRAPVHSPDDNQPDEAEGKTSEDIGEQNEENSGSGDREEIDGPESPPPESPPPESPVAEEDRGENREEGEADDDDDVISPSKKRRKIVNDSDSDGEEPPTKTTKVIMASDSEGEEDEETARSRIKRLMSSDDEEDEAKSARSGSASPKSGREDDEKSNKDEDDEGERSGAEEPVREGEDKDLVDNIFGGSDDEDGDGKHKNRGGDDDDDEGPRRDYDEDNGFEWDFDRMMREKKMDKKKRRSKKRGEGIDIINDDDGTVARMVEAMRAAAKDDRHSNTERRPALKKRKMLINVKAMLLRIDLVEPMLDGGMMSAVSEWLAPLPDKSLPCLEIRSMMLKLLQGFQLDQGILKQSGLGKAVMLLYKHPRETRENKLIAQKLISEWARPIFNLHTDFRSLSRDERLQRDYEHMPEKLRQKRESQDDSGPSTSGGGGLMGEGDDGVLRPGDKGFVGRARVPKPSTKDYVVRPQSIVEGEFKGASKSRGMNRLDRTTRDFKERTKKSSVRRAVGVSIEGRRMDL